MGMAESNGISRRLVLVPRDEIRGAPAAGAPHIRRFSLARVAVSPRSALGVDRHARLEHVADAEHREVADAERKPTG
jgi:hypothetical protein